MDKNIILHAAKLHPKEIMQPYDAIMEECGFDVICSISEHLGGFTVYVPALRTIFARCLEEEARKEFNGSNAQKISKKYGFSERHMRRILGLP
ncbi:MAG: hypothetical protein FWC89_10540 [Defluviitaleaceae bacterium]|nr:hypothetical protein [Defluviitaleaceae bacterium]